MEVGDRTRWHDHGSAGAKRIWRAKPVVPIRPFASDELRDPAQLRRSLALWAPLDPWATPDAFERIVDSFHHAGIAEFIVMWPPEDRLPLLESAAATIASLREREAH